MTVVGVLADTHIPDRVPNLDPKMLQTFREKGVAAILHAGDVSVPRVLTELHQIAPVYTVRGNRDILYLRHLPMRVQLNIDGVSIGMAHGHGTFSRYLIDKMQRVVAGRYAGEVHPAHAGNLSRCGGDCIWSSACAMQFSPRWETAI